MTGGPGRADGIALGSGKHSVVADGSSGWEPAEPQHPLLVVAVLLPMKLSSFGIGKQSRTSCKDPKYNQTAMGIARHCCRHRHPHCHVSFLSIDAVNGQYQLPTNW